MKKRAIAFILSILLSFFIFSACGGQTATPPKSGNNTEEQPAVDLEGAEVIFRTQISLTSSVFYPDEAENVRGDKMRQRYKDIGTKYNCKMTVEPYPGATDVADVTQAFLSGARFGDFYEGSPKLLYTMYKIGGIIPMSDIWDTEKIYGGKWGTKAALNSVT
jgi:hypothetical protein